MGIRLGLTGDHGLGPLVAAGYSCHSPLGPHWRFIRSISCERTDRVQSSKALTAPAYRLPAYFLICKMGCRPPGRCGNHDGCLEPYISICLAEYLVTAGFGLANTGNDALSFSDTVTDRAEPLWRLACLPWNHRKANPTVPSPLPHPFHLDTLPPVVLSSKEDDGGWG